MSIIKLLMHGGSVVKAISEMSEHLHDEEEKKERNIESLKAGLYSDNTDFEKTIKKNNLFFTGWRPAIGWVTVIAMFYQFVVYPILPLFMTVPNVDPAMQELTFSLVTLTLGVAGLRSYDKVKGTDTAIK